MQPCFQRAPFPHTPRPRSAHTWCSVAMSLVYWQLHGDDRTRRGTWMVWLLFGGGAIIAVALLANQVQGAAAYIPLDLVLRS